MPNTDLGLTSDEDPGVRRWMDLVSLLEILTIIGVAFWFYLSR
jgi:hypothetical protein